MITCAEPDPRQELAIYAAHVRQVAERAGGLLLAAWVRIRQRSRRQRTDHPELDAQRMRGMIAAASDIAAKATQSRLLWPTAYSPRTTSATLCGPSTRPSCTACSINDLGWTPDRFQYWLVRSWTRLLLDPR